MEPPEPVDLRPADWALIVEALVTFAGNPTELEGPGEERAYELVQAIADAHGLTPGDLVTSRDTGWDGDEVSPNPGPRTGHKHSTPRFPYVE